MDKKGKEVELLDPLTVERAQYVELRSRGAKDPGTDPRTGKPRERREGALLGNRLRDGAGLYLFITPNNSKSWRFDYRFDGERRVWVYGSYPDLCLKDARIRHAKIRVMLADGIDPAKNDKEKQEKERKEREKEKEARKNSFKFFGEDWYNFEIARAKKEGEPLSDAWESNYRRWLELAYKDFGHKSLPDITAADVRQLVKRIEKKEGFAATAEYLRQTVSRVFAHAIREYDATAGYNPAEALAGIVKVPKKRHHPKLEAEEIPEFISKVKNSSLAEDIKLGLLILLHTFPRRTELTWTPWKEINGDLWSISDDRMKKDRHHVIPMSTQVRAMFSRLKELSGDSPYVFPSPRQPSKPRNKGTFNEALRELGYQKIFSPHSARSTAVSALSDSGFPKDVVKAQLAHGKDNGTDAAYFRNTYVEPRRRMLQYWSDYLDGKRPVPQLAQVAA